jgi:isochorismate pyruvate lyase
MKEAKDCQNIQEIRDAIDDIDYQIIVLFGERDKYVREIVKFKSSKDEIVAKERQLEVLQNRKKWAMQFGLDPELYVDIYKTLICRNIQKEIEIHGNIEK